MLKTVRKTNNKTGFTLVEVLVSLFVFTVTISIANTLFTAATRLEREGSTHRFVQQNGTFLFEFLGKEIRNGSIDYQAYIDDGIDLNLQPVTKLKLLYRGTTDQSEEVYLDSGKIYIKRERLGEQNVYDTSVLTDDKVIVDSLAFYIAPAQKCTEASSSCAQQRVTIAAKISSNTDLIKNIIGTSINLQTTFSVRLYDL